MTAPSPRNALKIDLFADQARKRKIGAIGDPLQRIAATSILNTWQPSSMTCFPGAMPAKAAGHRTPRR